jgi:putative NIF3 family GTP cyclohydrolase 1 type 2
VPVAMENLSQRLHELGWSVNGQLDPLQSLLLSAQRVLELVEEALAVLVEVLIAHHAA